jgi:hypothetical protein
MKLSKCKCGRKPRLDKDEFLEIAYRYDCKCGKSADWYYSKKRAKKAWNKLIKGEKNV